MDIDVCLWCACSKSYSYEESPAYFVWNVVNKVQVVHCVPPKARVGKGPGLVVH